MTTRPPLILALYDKTLAPMDWLGAPLNVTATIRYNAASTLQFTVDGDDEQVEVLNTPGARLVAWYLPDPDDPDEQVFLISGRIQQHEGESVGAQTKTYTVRDDWGAVFGELDGWPNPAGTISQQGNEGAYFTSTGAAETVLKEIVAANAGRHSPTLTVAPTGGRGSNITVSVRFHLLGDRLFPVVDQAGVGVTVRQSGAGLLVDCFTPVTHDVVLTEESGIVTDGSYTIEAPTVTRVVVLGGGQGTARVARLVIDAAAEAKWGFRAVGVVDARDTSDTAILDKRGQAALVEAAETQSVTAGLSETDDFRFGVAFNLGDIVPVQLNGAPPITDRVREVKIDWTPDAGCLVTPHVGNLDHSPEAVMAAAIRRIAGAQRDQKVSY